MNKKNSALVLLVGLGMFYGAQPAYGQPEQFALQSLPVENGVARQYFGFKNGNRTVVCEAQVDYSNGTQLVTCLADTNGDGLADAVIETGAEPLLNPKSTVECLIGNGYHADQCSGFQQTGLSGNRQFQNLVDTLFKAQDRSVLARK